MLVLLGAGFFGNVVVTLVDSCITSRVAGIPHVTQTGSGWLKSNPLGSVFAKKQIGHTPSAFSLF